MSETIHYIRRNSALFPLRMEGIADSPKGLYYIGELPDDTIPSVAVVGARSCSSYGRKTAYALGKFLAEHGIQVVSGMAMGIDSASQEGALAGGGRTFAVLGCGVDICYPRSSYSLYEELKKRGGIIAEVEPGMPPLAHNFPLRNRIISALSDIVVVVEAREKSGSLITVDCALEQGRTVFAVPGRLGDRLSDGCNYLIAQGAGIVWSHQAVLDEIMDTASLHRAAARARQRKAEQNDKKADCGTKQPAKSVPVKKYHQMTLHFDSDEENRVVDENVFLSEEAKILYGHIGTDPVGADTLSEETQIPVRKVLSAAVELVMEDYIREVAKNLFVRK